MRRALSLAARAAGETNPNPLVGCVIVRRGRIVGEGYHRRAGGPHAEILALEQAGARARGATLYVNLEPCAHQGRTPPCAPPVAAAGLARVVAAIRDPNPRVSGRGFALLRRAGIDCDVGVMESEARRLNERFLVACREQRPFVLLKAALTLDGRIATASGDSKWITSAAERRAARRLRRLHDAVLVGIGTALADDPLLLPSPRLARPYHRVVLDADLRLSPEGRLARSSRSQPVLLLCRRRASARRRQALARRGVVAIDVPAHGGRLRLRAVLRALWRRGITSVMVEGGSEVLGSFLAERLYDKVALFRAPLLLGGRGSRPAFGGPDPRRIRDAQRLRSAGRGEGGAELWYPEG